MLFKNLKRVIINLLLLCTTQLFAQLDEGIEDELVDYQYWIDYNVNINIKNNFSLYGDTGFRIISPYIWTRYYIRPAVRYTHKLKAKSKKALEIIYHFGIGTFFTNYNDIPNHLEIRPFRGVQLRWPNFKYISFSHYARLEQQIDYFNNNWDFGLRARYMLAGTFEFYKTRDNFIDQIYIPFSVELFWNLDKSQAFNDVVRITPGIGYIANPKWRFELSLSYHRRKFELEDEFNTNDIVFRLRVFQNLN